MFELAAPPMTPDEICLAALSRGLVKVDPETGQVSSGRFRSKPTLGTANAKGYRVCTIVLDGRRCQAKIHRLVWMSVNGPIPPGLVIDHINRDKADNRLANLRLADAGLNSRNRRSYAGAGNPAARIDAAKAVAIRGDHRILGSYAKVAVQHGVSKSLVAQIVRGELWKS